MHQPQTQLGHWFSGDLSRDRPVLWTTGQAFDAVSTRSVASGISALFAEHSGAVVVVAGDTSPRTALAIVAAQAAGCVVTVVDKRLPVPYVENLVHTIQPSAIAFRSRRRVMAESAAPPETRLVDLDACYDEFDRNGTPADLGPLAAQSGPATLVFSSGSSGEPKGVLQHHEAIAFESLRYHEWIQPAKDTCLGVVSSLGFTSTPASLASMWRTGGQLAFYDIHRRGIWGLVAFLRRSRVTNMRVQTAVLRAMCDLEGLPTTDLRSVSVAGEPLFAADIDRFRRAAPEGCDLHIAYSSTETGTIGETYVRAGDPVSEWSGGFAPSTGTKIEIVDEFGQAVADGELGEIVVSSPSLAAGYFGRIDLSSERFVERDGQRFFHTRDLGRQIDSNRFTIAGRLDHRLKIRGYNVEPSVVEAAIMMSRAPHGRSWTATW